MLKNNIAKIKSLLLSREYIQIASDIDPQELTKSTGNIGKCQWIFIRISNSSRVRLTVTEYADLKLLKSKDNNYYIQDIITHEIIIENITIERILAHAPEQLFFLLYKNCTSKCLFCPLTYSVNNTHYSWERIQNKISDNITNNILSVGFTTSCPPGKTNTELVAEMVDVVSKTRNLLGENIPIGVSLKAPSKEQLLHLKEAGVSEVRLNIETYNSVLAKTLMPNKDINKILHSIAVAVDIFGKEKVSSNIIIGLGESDNDILSGISRLAEIGALSTLYPFDPIKIFDNNFKRPSAERIYNLAIEHKKILNKYNLNSLAAKTMCCACSASHVYPGRDL